MSVLANSRNFNSEGTTSVSSSMCVLNAIHSVLVISYGVHFQRAFSSPVQKQTYPRSKDTMQIFVQARSTITLNVEASDSVESVKALVAEREGVCCEDQRLVFGGKQLENGRSLSDYSISPESTIHMSLRMLGGHCQVPCGIFDDPALVGQVKQACATIRKAMVQINELSANMTAQNFNQMTRWVNTKEEHAKKIIDDVSEYCLCQRVKPVGAAGCPFASEKDYVDALTAHHKVMQAAMKAKQTVDVAQCDALDHAVEDFAKMYLPAE